MAGADFLPSGKETTTVPMMKALREFTYGQTKRRAGDRFTVVSKQHVAALEAAKLAEVDVAATDDAQDEVRAQTKELDAQPKRGRGRPKGTYKRRDLVAE